VQLFGNFELKSEIIMSSIRKRKPEFESAVRPTAFSRKYSISIAVPGSIIANCQSKELQSYVAGQIARTAAIFRVDEIVVFAENPSEPLNGSFDPDLYLARQLEYLETPQYLRKALFPISPDLKYAGLQNPLDAPHHLRIFEDSQFREGVVVAEKQDEQVSNWVNCGLDNWVDVKEKLPVNSRVTVRLENDRKRKKKRNETIEGKIVPRHTPTAELGIYWGYDTRIAKNGLSQVISEAPWKSEGGYDFAIGTSERGESIFDSGFSLDISGKKHILIVFGGVKGIETCVLGDPALSDISVVEELFDRYLNTCPSQGSRTIRTEEALTITLAGLQHLLK
jgi:predicted SPOUT superfamily RNA methylase MTH1